MNYKLILDITDYIIFFPIKWYNLVQRVINKATAYHNVMIVAKNTLVNNNNAFEEVVNILSNHQIIIKKVENKDFLILYFKNQNLIKIFDCWLNIIVLRCFVDLFSQVECTNILDKDFYIKLNDNKIFIGPNQENNSYYVSTNQRGEDNEIIYNYNYFSFKNSIAEIFCLHSIENNV